MNLMAKAGNWCRSSRPNRVSTSTFGVGSRIEVGEFFWIPDDSIIGWDSDAIHANGPKHSSGSVDEGCDLTIRAIRNGYAIVRLDRPHLPGGAQASIGTVFQVPLEQMMRWPAMVKRRRDHERQRRALAAEFCQ